MAPSPMTVQQLADSQATAVKTLYRLEPTKNKEEFEHYRLMADIRMLYLNYQKIEKQVNMPSFTKEQLPAVLQELKQLLGDTKKIDQRFIDLNKNTLYMGELKQENNLRDSKINLLYKRLTGRRNWSKCNHVNHKLFNMKNIYFLVLLLISASVDYGQEIKLVDSQRKDITMLIAQYSHVRESRDTIMLKKILTTDVDQLVSTGEWRSGIGAAVEGMMKSSTNNPGSRTLIVDKIRLVTPVCAIVDCRYEIANANGNPRKMWSSFIVVAEKGVWKISAIRNMLPATR